MFPPYTGYGLYGTYGNLGLYGALVAYGSVELTESSPAQSFDEPLTVAEVAKFLELPQRATPDEAEAAMLTGLIIGAREHAEFAQGRDLVRKQFDAHFDYWPSYRIELRPQLASVDLVQYTDSQNAVTTLTEGTHYIVDKFKQPGVLVPPYNATWPTFAPRPSSAILIRFTCGYSSTAAFWSDSGARIKVGMKQLISEWFSERLPFQRGVDQTSELPYSVTHNLSCGALRRAR
jgi:uncharacterized phiE125 gp8 family phage protein